jgi:dolichol-phosphate mannosyltransferase
MNRVIVTGGSGFVGANLARRLVHDGHEVHLFLRKGYRPWRVEALRAEARFTEVDFGDADGLAHIVADIRPDWVFHLAAYGAYPDQTDARRMVDTNIVGTMNLVAACLKTGFQAFINTGSSSEYGFKNHAPSETDWLEPNSHYAVTKASATLFCRYTAQCHRVRLPTLRLYSVYGPYEEPTRLIPTLIVKGLRGELPPLVNPDIARDYVYVEDVIDAYLLAATQPANEPGAAYNVGTGIQTSLREVVEVARSVMGISAEPQWGTMANRSWDTGIWVADNRKMQAELGWHPQYSFEQGFRLTADWFRDTPEIRDFYEHPYRRHG